jgi:hypothetical protein
MATVTFKNATNGATNPVYLYEFTCNYPEMYGMLGELIRRSRSPFGFKLCGTLAAKLESFNDLHSLTHDDSISRTDADIVSVWTPDEWQHLAPITVRLGILGKAPTRATIADTREWHAGQCCRQIGPKGGITVTVERWRPNGMLQTWKRSPERFRQPIKYGLYQYTSIEPGNAYLFHDADDCPMDVS